jgi:hypothetical protein
MKRLLAVSSLFLVAAAPPMVVERGIGAPRGPIVIQMDAVPTGALVTMLMKDVAKVPYVIAPEILQDRSPTSVNLRIPRNDVPNAIALYLRTIGINLKVAGGTVYVSRSGRSGGRVSYPSNLFGDADPDRVPMGSPVEMGRPDFPRATERPSYVVRDPVDGVPRPDVAAPRSGRDRDGGGGSAPAESLVGYLPAHRDPSYLSSVIAPLLPGITFGARQSVQADTDKGNVSPSNDLNDVLVMAGAAEDIGRAKRLVQLLDRPRPMVAVKAVVMQVNDTRNRGSALSILAKIGGSTSVSVGSFAGGAVPSASQFVRVVSGSVTALLSAAREDSRVRVVATPNVVALSGASAVINSGSQVPTLSSVAVADGGVPVQSVSYRDSGITLSIRPVVRGDLVELDVTQERSSFIRTTTGVEDSPTLNKASANASVVLRSGESLVLAGLTEDSTGNTREGLLGGLLGVRTREKSESELLVVLQAEIVPAPVAPAGQFIDLDKGKDVDDVSATDPLAPIDEPRTAIGSSRA